MAKNKKTTPKKLVAPLRGKATPGTRDARLEIRLTPEDKELFAQAAAVGGEDVSGFVRRVGLTEARSVLAAGAKKPA